LLRSALEEMLNKYRTINTEKDQKKTVHRNAIETNEASNFSGQEKFKRPATLG
jgi:hypothetical protein